MYVIIQPGIRWYFKNSLFKFKLQLIYVSVIKYLLKTKVEYLFET